MKNRRTFLKEVCPTVAFAFFGVSFLEACSADSTDEISPSPGGGGNNGVGSSQGNGFTFANNTYTIDLTHSNFSNLSEVGGWMNAQSLGIPMLFLRVSSTEVNAYTNVCPHDSVQTSWNYQSSTNRFRCGAHGNTYPDDCNTAGTDGGPLSCYTTDPIDGNTFKVYS